MLILALGWPTSPGSAQAPPAGKWTDASNMPPVIIDYFYQGGCPDCLRIKSEIVPDLTTEYAGLYVLYARDLGIESNMIALLKYQDALRITGNEPVCMVVDYEDALNGFPAISRGLFERLDFRIAERLEPGWHPPVPIAVDITDSRGILAARARNFTLPAVIAAGLADSVNPCAVGTLVFLMSMLAVSGIKGRRLVLVGACFCLASFLVYTAIGFGLLRVVYACSGFPLVRQVIEIGMIALLTVLALLSFRDALRYAASGKADSVTLQLPSVLKTRIRSIIRAGIGARRLAVGAFLAGAAVTALESVCTGQEYLPTLVLMVKSGMATPRLASYLLLYNLLFIVPLIVVVTLTCFGVGTDTLLAWSRRNVVPAKVLLGILFVGLAVLIWVL